MVGFTAEIAELARSLFRPSKQRLWQQEEREENWEFVLMGIFSQRMRLPREGIICKHTHNSS